MRFYLAIFIFFTHISFSCAEAAAPAQVATGITHANPPFMIPLTDSQKSFMGFEKNVFDMELSVRSFDPEEDHVWAAKRWVEALTSPVSSEEEFLATLWVNGQQIAALERQNRIFVRSKGSTRNASLVIEKEVEKHLVKYCSMQENSKECLVTLKEKALKLSDIFWGDFKKAASEDFKKNKLNQNKISFHQIRGQIREAFRNPQSDAWVAMNDYMAALKASNITATETGKNSILMPRAIPIIPPDSGHTGVDVGLGQIEKKAGIHANLAAAKKRLVQKLGIIPKIEEVEEERKPWNYVDSKSTGYDLSRATSRYAQQVVRALACEHFEEASLLNGQIIARVLRAGSSDVAQITSATAAELESWCYSQFSRAAQIIECKNKLSPHFAELNRYYWQGVESAISKNKSSATSTDVDAYFSNLKNSQAIKDPEHPLGKIHANITGALQQIKGDWAYNCLSEKDEALGDYRSIKAIAEAKAISDHLLNVLKKNPLRSPPAMCAKAVKTGMHAAGLLKSYPGWPNATSLANAFEKENSSHIHLKEGYELKRIETINPLEAPPYSIIVYGNGNGHVEQKIPSSDLVSKGIDTMYAYGKKLLQVKDQEFAYVSDYIDAYPRNHPKSRTSRGDGSNNGRPVLGIYVIMRKS